MSKYCAYDSSLKIWSGPKYTPIYNPNANLGYLILNKLIQRPQEVFQISDDTGVELTNLDIYERFIKFARFLSTSMGLKQGDVVGVISSNSENLVPIFFACFTLGLAVNPLAITFNERDICYMWSKTKPKLIFSDAKIIEVVRSAVDKMELDSKIYTMVDKVDGYSVAEDILKVDMDIEEFEFPELPNIQSTIALIMCSSGTTSEPKGVCKSHKQLITQAITFHAPNFKTQDIYFISTWSFWVSYFWSVITSALYDKKIVITSQTVNPDLWIDIIERRKVTYVPLAPKFGIFVLKSKNLRPLPSICNVVVAGSVFSAKLIENLKPIFPNGNIICGYGCTEGDGITTTEKCGLKGASSGYPFKNVKIKIINEQGTPLGPNEVGEICFKTAVPFSSYFGDSENYKASFDSDGFLKSGDVGYVDDECYLFILDRIKHLIKTVNFKLFPMDLEEVINEIDGVIQSCVVGVFDEKVFYEIIYAFVIKDNSKTELTEEFVLNYVNERVIDSKKIHGGVIFVDQFPMTPTGKILNRKLRDLAMEIHQNKKK